MESSVVPPVPKGDGAGKNSIVVRRRLIVRGMVQGVGFRPFVYRTALAGNLRGFVRNSPQGVEIEVEGDPAAVDRFSDTLRSEAPVLARITRLDIEDIPAIGDETFAIRSSREEDSHTVLIPPDVSLCDDCQSELFDPGDRRYRYPFINCTNCGPRFTIIREVPYDRPKTTMADFTMCSDCRREYEDPANRRFHAQPNACPVCGPTLRFVDPMGRDIKGDPIGKAVEMLRDGKIVAVKGIGGFHLACDAASESAVQRLRRLKQREEKPLAVMARDMGSVRAVAESDDRETTLLLSPQRPIVLVRKKEPCSLAPSVSPQNRNVGLFLPYTPLHALLLREGPRFLVMTSGNLSDEPVVLENDEAVRRLGGIADGFLVHDRDIHARCDDSVAVVVEGITRMIRRARGYVPVPVFLSRSLPPVLAVGAELKNTVCLVQGDRAFLGSHVGDLENLETYRFFEESISHLQRTLGIRPVVLAHDLHPDYLSTRWAEERKDLPRKAVQHHHAHIASCMAENGWEKKVIGLALDGTGYGTDGRIWGGEVLVADFSSFERVAHFDNRFMPGGFAAIREPWRMALSYLYTLFLRTEGALALREDFIRWIKPLGFTERLGDERIAAVSAVIRQGRHGVLTSSLGRLFDGAASILGLRDGVAFEGQAAMELEMAMDTATLAEPDNAGYRFSTSEQDGLILIIPDSALQELLADRIRGVPVSTISFRFHSGLVDLFGGLCRTCRSRFSISAVALSGGCFQNRFLSERLVRRLRRDGFDVLTHSQVPTNDGGISLGQAMVVAASLSNPSNIRGTKHFALDKT